MQFISLKAIRRSFATHKFYTLINMLGLSTSLAVCLFIFLYVKDELSYDRFHKSAPDIYRVALTLKFEDLNVFLPMASPPVAETMQQEIPEIEETIRLYGIDMNMSFRVDDKAFTEKKVLYADSNFYKFFDFELIKGDPETVLKEPNTVVLTSAMALKYFNTEDAVGKLLTIDGVTYSVSGIAKAPPSNSQIVFDALISMNSNELAESSTWMANRFFTYVKLHPDAQQSSVEKKLDDLVVNHIGPDLENSLGVTLNQFVSQGNKIGYDLHKMTDTHLRTKFPRDITPASDITYVYLFIGVGIALLCIACINFMNLSTARSAGKMREASIRRTLGSSRAMLISQYFSESFALTLAAAVLAVIGVYFLLPQFNLLSGKNLTANSMDSVFMGGVFLIILVTGLVSGSYPALYLTSAKVTEGIKGKTTKGKGSAVRSTLVIIQNSVSVGLIIFTLILFQQLQFIGQKNLGFNKEGVVVLRNVARLSTNAEPLKNALRSESGIEAVSFSDRMVFEKMSADAVRDPHKERSHILNFYCADEDQLKVMDYELVKGRFFSKDFISDSNAVVINEATMREFGWKDIENQEMAADGDYRYKVVGVVKDFNYESLRNDIKPLMIVYVPEGNTLNVKYSGIAAADVVTILEKNWQKYGNGEPFEYSFLDSDFDALFRSEQRISKLFVLFSILILFIACLGLFGLASFSAEQRVKEIGIRKTLGASITNIVTLFSFQFVRLVLIAILLSIAPVYFFVTKWLSGFAYRIEIGPAPFLMAGVVAILISILTVGYQSIKAARTNPVKALRSE